MKEYIIDTNALISFVTDRNAEQQLRISSLFRDAALLKKMIYCPQNVLTEFIYVMAKVYAVSRSDIKTMVGDFLVLPGVKIIHEIDFETVFSYWPEAIPDFGDAVVVSVCRSFKESVIATFDQKFISRLKRLGFEIYAQS